MGLGGYLAARSDAEHYAEVEEVRAGFIPLGPYFFAASPATALTISVVVTLLALALFGYVKGHFTGSSPLRSGLQTTLIGGLAAAFGIAKLVTS